MFSTNYIDALCRGPLEKSDPQRADQMKVSQQLKNRILVIDDSADFLVLTRTILELEDYEVYTALDGNIALKILTTKALPNLILLDMRMQDMSGPEFLAKIEVVHPEILAKVPVVFLTALDEVPASRAVGFIKKPFDFERFLEAVRNYIVSGPIGS